MSGCFETQMTGLRMEFIKSKLYELVDVIRSPFGVSSAYIQALFPLIEEYGVGPNTLLDQAGVKPEQINDAQYRVPLYKAFRLLKLAIKACDDPYLPIKLGRMVDTKATQILGYACIASSNLSQAIDRLVQFETLVWDIGDTQKTLLEDRLRITWRAKGVPERWVPKEIVELVISGWVHFGYQITQADKGVLRICFRHDGGGCIKEYSKRFNCPVEFNASFNGVELMLDSLDVSLHQADPNLCTLMERQGSELIKRYKTKVNIVNEVRAVVFQKQLWRDPRIETIADALDLTVSNLRCALCDTEYTVNSIVEEVRRELEFLHFDDAGLGLTDVALLLGFSGQNTFIGAFDCWADDTSAHYGLAATKPRSYSDRNCFGIDYTENEIGFCSVNKALDSEGTFQ